MAFDALKGLLSQSTVMNEGQLRQMKNPYARLSSVLGGVGTIAQTQSAMSQVALSKEQLENLKTTAEINRGVNLAMEEIQKDKDSQAFIKNYVAKNKDKEGVFASNIASLIQAKKMFPKYAAQFEEGIVNIRNMIKNQEHTTAMRYAQDMQNWRTTVNQYGSQLAALDKTLQAGGNVVNELTSLTSGLFTNMLTSAFTENMDDKERKEYTETVSQVKGRIDQYLNSLGDEKASAADQQKFINFLRFNFMNVLSGSLPGAQLSDQVKNMDKHLEKMIGERGAEKFKEMNQQTNKQKEASPEEVSKEKRINELNQQARVSILKTYRENVWDKKSTSDPNAKFIIKELKRMENFDHFDKDELILLFDFLKRLEGGVRESVLGYRLNKAIDKKQ